MIDIVDKSNIITIGIMEEGNHRSTFKYLKKILLEENYNVGYKNSNDSIILLRKDEKEVFIIDINSMNIEAIKNIGLEFNVFVHNFTNAEVHGRNSLNKILKSCEYLIANCDQEEWNFLIKDNTKSIVITYGFSNKATVTVSSHNIDDFIEANICFQRTIHSIYGLNIDPLEIHIKIDSNRKGDIYCAIAAMIGISIFDSAIILNKSTIII